MGRKDKVVIPMRRVRPFCEWTKTVGGGGIVWRTGDRSTGTSEAESGKLCFRVRFELDGTHYLTPLTAAPHATDHNDIWISFSGGLQLLKADTLAVKNTKSAFDAFKAY